MAYCTYDIHLHTFLTVSSLSHSIQGWFHSGVKTPEDTVNDFFVSMQKNGYVTFHKEPNT